MDEPFEYVRQICFESSAFLPVYHFLVQARVSLKEALSMLEEVQSTLPSKARLIQRLRSNQTQSLPVPVGENESSQQKLRHRQDLIEKKVRENVSSGDIMKVLQSIRTLKAHEIDRDYLLPLLRTWFDNFYGKPIRNINNVRRAVCYVDEVIHKASIEDEPAREGRTAIAENSLRR